MTSTYENPDVTGVVLILDWNDLQYDDAGTIRERWQHLDRELERAVTHGKLVTLDIRAGMDGTPDWIFTDYLRNPSPYGAAAADPAHAAPWCAAAGCTFPGDHPADAGLVGPLTFLDHYDETPPGDGCGSPVRIGSPGDVHYRALYKDFLARLAAHLATDTRWWDAVAHIKVSGANLLTSEAELPHHCDDDYANTGEHTADPKSTTVEPGGDRVLDVFKTLRGNGEHVTHACKCNPQIWLTAGYQPQQLYDYYAEVEQQIVTSFFGEKSLGYQIIQDGFPRANATTGGFQGDDLYQEQLVPSTTPPASIPNHCGNGVLDGAEACDDGNADETDGCRSDCTLTYEVDAAFDAGLVCAAPSLNASTLLPEVDEDRVGGTAEYCSSDSLLTPPGTDYQLAIVPLQAGADRDVAAYPDDHHSGSRYPGPFDQSVEVLDEAGNGRFTDPYVAGHTDRLAGKLFVPQHSGIQPFPQEGVALAYRGGTSIACNQQLAPLDPATTGWPASIIAAVGPKVAGFPILSTTAATGLSDPATTGCPNEWIVDQGKNRDLAPFTYDPPGAPPPVTKDILYPAQVTGFQVPNDTRSIAHVESALFNLVYNSNGVFLELYEDSIWQIGRSRGTGSSAVTLDDPAAPVRLAQSGGVYTACDPAVSCYSKRLSEWAAELRGRRAVIARDFASYLHGDYPGLQDPFPSSYQQTFTNTTGTDQYHAYIDPPHCDPTKVDLTIGNGVPGALGIVHVLP